ncbi:type VI secretion system tip protein VgrG [Escherichia coli]|nr:type VI secretion system tip protein VgrG [Escherichia coli]
MAYLTVWQGDDVQRRVKGVVTWFELGENDKNQMLYSMKVCPPLWRTGLRQNFRIFQNEDIESILATILKENGVTEWSPLFSEPHPSREFCVQYGETDYDFLCRMAAEEGIFFYEEHAQKSTDQSLVLCDTVRYLPESFEIPWNPNTRTEVSTLCISQFRYSAQIRPSSVVTKDYTFKRPGWAGRFDQEGQHQDYQRTQYEVYDYPGRFKGAHGQNFARWQMDGWRNNAETARGTSRSPEIWPGRRIVLTGQTAIYSAGEHLELCCGKARLVLTKDGQIFLNGTKIHLQGKEQVNGDSLLINWNCAASKSPPKTPDEKQDTPDMREY